MLAETELDKGGRPTVNHLHDASSLPKLKELGIEKDQSSRWQNIANIPEQITIGTKSHDVTLSDLGIDRHQSIHSTMGIFSHRSYF